MNGTIVYLLNKATESEIFNHLSACDAEFVRALSDRVDIKEYSRKIHDRAMRFEAWAGSVLIGLVAAYYNDQSKRMAYITSVSVLAGWQGKGIAAQLIRRSIDHARMLGMDCISLEVAAGNAPAIGLYEKCGFVAADAVDSAITMNLFLRHGENNAK